MDVTSSRLEGKQKACLSACCRSLHFQIISKADETHLFYFVDVSSEQVVLIAIADILKSNQKSRTLACPMASFSRDLWPLSLRPLYNGLRARPFPGEEVPEVGDR